MKNATLWSLAMLMAMSACAAESSRAQTATEASSFEIEDYFRLKRVTELALSSDARWLAYVVESFAGGAWTSQVYLRDLKGDKEILPDELADGHALAWIPGARELAFLAERGGSSQVYSYDPVAATAVRRTQSADSVQSFRFAPGGKRLAYTTLAEPESGASLYEQFREGQQGILIDSSTISAHDFVNPRSRPPAQSPPLVLWTATNSAAAMRAPIPGEVSADLEAFFWSSDGRFLSITYVGSEIPGSQFRDEHTSVGILDAESTSFRVLAKAQLAQGNRSGTNFKGGEWLPRQKRVLIRRVTETDPWVSDSHPDWTIANALQPSPQSATAWRPIEVYPRGSRFHPLSASTVLIENTVEGVHSLFALKNGEVARSAVVKGIDGGSSLFQFSVDFSDVVFVNESLTRPPEIYARLDGEPLWRVTDLNSELARKIQHTAREVSWISKDGAMIKGWLLEPLGPRPEKGWPLVTHVHGGPSFPFPDAFAPYFSFWPYPLEVYAAHGMAVFMPNYRGTHTYGRRIASPVRDEPAEDIITGVEALIASGVADAMRLGISGHSHGAMLGPVAMARAGTFRASSFAEGVASSVVMYELMSDDANREIHDTTMGVSLYESPQRYLDESPNLQFRALSTASLFEAGPYATAIFMLGFPKAAKRAGMPTEFIIYPQTGHNLVIPRLQREAAERNLDWFNFWLREREHPNPDKRSQYQRWRELRR